MHELNADRSLAHSRSNTLDASGAHVTGGEDPRHAALQQVRRTWQAPALHRPLLLSAGGARFHEAVTIQHHAALQPARVRPRAGHEKHMSETTRFGLPIA